MGRMFQRAKPFNPETQVLSMRSSYPDFKCNKKGLAMEFTGILRVMPELPEYTVTVIYDLDKRPKVYIRAPQLLENAPHLYPDGTLCLYHPDNYHWTREKLIAKEIMSWTAAWIYFYEVWLETGKWFGPEVNHQNPKIPND
ncbi:MAG: hypothetical protein SFW35_02940 [Chitinophagales bacterium]|nr:hypothetical protein [Chitinophagales bacterium]